MRRTWESNAKGQRTKGTGNVLDETETNALFPEVGVAPEPERHPEVEGEAMPLGPKIDVKRNRHPERPTVETPG